ncbi:uncharacterized protein LOC144712984 isoform X2 [Wolffia australiana]
MEGSEGDGGPPDSWELADLEETVSRLLISSPPPRKKTSSGEFAEGPALPSISSSADAPVFEPSPLQGAAVEQVDQFLKEALEKPRERLAILRMEQDIEKFLSNPTQQQIELQPLPNSYLRLAAHRIAQHYSLQSVAMPDSSSLDISSSRIFLRKTPSSRLPPIRLADIPVNLPKDEGSGSMVNVAIKRRPQKYPQSGSLLDADSSSRANQAKSVEERKEEYNRARARIFSGTANAAKAEADVPSVESSAFPQQSPGLASQPEEKPFSELNIIRYGSGESLGSNSGSNTGRDGIERDPNILNRYKLYNRVAIFRDRELDRRDPDYDRNYDRYAQRFDPGFGFGGGGGYGIQPLYSPAVNYNAEFPQLGATHVAQMPMEHRQSPVPQHVHGSWAGARSPSAAVGYGPAEALVPSFSGNQAVYLASSPYLLQPRGPRSGVGFIHRPEHPITFSQSHQQQQRPDSNFGLPRPR